MDASKYNRSVTLLCPTCGNTEFAHEENSSELVRCASCGREFTKDDLIRENSENISIGVEEMKQQVVKDITKEFKSALQGIKGLKIR